MFTGIVQKTGTVVAMEQGGGAGTLRVEATAWGTPLALGESIGINGTCLSLAAQVDQLLSFDILQETFDKTNLGALVEGSQVNLERALAHGDPLGGHIVSGHVDGIGTVRSITPVGRDKRVEIACLRIMRRLSMRVRPVPPINANILSVPLPRRSPAHYARNPCSPCPCRKDNDPPRPVP